MDYGIKLSSLVVDYDAPSMYEMKLFILFPPSMYRLGADLSHGRWEFIVNMQLNCKIATILKVVSHL